MITDAAGVPLLIETTPANQRDEQPLLEMLGKLPVPVGAMMGDRACNCRLAITAVAALRLVSLG